MDRWSVTMRAASVSFLTQRHGRRGGARLASPGIYLKCRSMLVDMAAVNWWNWESPTPLFRFCARVSTSFGFLDAKIVCLLVLPLPLKPISVWINSLPYTNWKKNPKKQPFPASATCFAKRFCLSTCPKYLPLHTHTRTCVCFKV